ncbi:MAG: RNA recognition motif domain-containing protein [Chthoniobacterales bacterium]
MASQTSGRHSRRPRGGGSRRRSDDRPYRQNTNTTRTPAKKSFWDKIMSFFSGNGNPPIARVPEQPRNGSSSSASGREQPARTPRSKPESVAVTTPRLYVGNLSFEATESDLFELFNGVGQVQNAEVVTYKHNQRSKGFAFVQMNTVEEAQRAVTELHDKDFLGRKLLVSGAKSTDRAE